MRTIAKLFGKSPFTPLQNHMEKVHACMKTLSKVFNGIDKIDGKQIERLASLVSKLEHEADLTKNDIRNQLPKSLFLPVDRHQLLEILSIQDSIADKAEEIAHLLTMRPLDKTKELIEYLQAFYQKSFAVFLDTSKIVKEIDELLETTFGGAEAERVRQMVDQISYKEYESDLMKHTLLKECFAVADTLSTPSFYLWTRLIEEIGAIAHISEKLASRIRLLLERK